MRRARIFFSLITVATVAVAQEQAPVLPLPQLERCNVTAHPLLPENWKATYLMAPFTNGQLVFAEITHDESIPATRVTLHGARRGSLDLLVENDKTYLLHSEDSEAAQCEDLGDTTWRPLPRDLLAPQSQCDGSGPVGDVEVDWWKTPVEPAPSSYWIWYKSSDQTPFRLVFQSANDRLGILSQHALSYQVRFSSIPHTDLADVAKACRAAKPASTAQSLRERIDAMAQAPERAERAIKELMPEFASCSAASFPTWPKQLAITGLMTPFDSNESPYPTEVLYDWSVPGQRSRIFFPPGSPIAAQDALLLGPHGYNVTYHRQRAPICAPVLPGTIRPDWAARAPCSCEGMIEGRTPLTPHGTTQILTCPLASPRAAWAWYSLSGRPTAFMVTSLPGDEGAGLFAVLDYRDWLPGYRIKRSIFDKPPQCEQPPARRGAGPMASAPPPSAASPASTRCTTCHLGRAPAQ